VPDYLPNGHSEGHVTHSLHRLYTCNCRKNDVIRCSVNVMALLPQPWDGSYHMRRKTGENFSLRCRFIPVIGHCGQVFYHVHDAYHASISLLSVRFSL